MITIREAFDTKTHVMHGARVVDSIVAMPGDMYQVYFFGGLVDTFPGCDLFREICEERWLNERRIAELEQRAEREQIAKTIVAQMGGLGRLKAMVGARGFVYLESGVQFSFSGKRGMNKCRVIYNPGPDLYTFELWYVNARKATCDLKFKLDDVYCDMLTPLFEEQTGLYLSI